MTPEEKLAAIKAYIRKHRRAPNGKIIGEDFRAIYAIITEAI